MGKCFEYFFHRKSARYTGAMITRIAATTAVTTWNMFQAVSIVPQKIASHIVLSIAFLALSDGIRELYTRLVTGSISVA